MNKRVKKLIAIISIISMVSGMAFCANASILDDFLAAIGLNTETEVKETEGVVDTKVEESLDNRQREVVEKIDEIYKNISETDFDGLIDNLDYKVTNVVKKNVDEFFNDYSESKDAVNEIMSSFKYKVEDVSNAGGEIVAKVTVTFPSIKDLLLKALPSIIIKNVNIITGGEMNNENLDSIIKSVRDEVIKGSDEAQTFTRDFRFKHVDGEWKLTDVDSIVSDLEKYVSDLSSGLFKK